MKKLLVFLLLISISLAQTSDWSLAFLKAVLGELPPICEEGITPECFQCISIIKIVPFFFFIAIFYFTFFYIFSHASKVVTEVAGVKTETWQIPKVGTKVAALLSVLLSTVILHIGTITSALDQLIFWLGLTFIFLAIILSGAIGKFAGPFSLLILLLIILGLWSYIFSYLQPSLLEIQDSCMI